VTTPRITLVWRPAISDLNRCGFFSRKLWDKRHTEPMSLLESRRTANIAKHALQLRRYLRSGTLALTAALAFAPLPVFHASAAFAQDKPLVTVNGQSITQADVKRAESEMGPELARLPEVQRRQRIIQILVETEVMATAAETDKLGQGPDFEARLKSYRRRALRDTYFEKKIRDGVGDADVKAFYDKQAELMKANPQVRARHILVEKEEDAKALRARIVKGEDFAKLAKENSKDPGSGANGGDLGFMQKGQTVPAFDEMLFKLKPGEMSEPVKTEFGYHILKVEEHRLLPPLAELKDRMSLHLIQEKAQTISTELRTKAKIEYLDPDLKKLMEPETMQLPPGMKMVPPSPMPAKK
jgi:peptidyl-prolyl cis-trans isomerase C